MIMILFKWIYQKAAYDEHERYFIKFIKYFVLYLHRQLLNKESRKLFLKILIISTTHQRRKKHKK